MDSTTPSHRSNPIPASRLARISCSVSESNQEPPPLSLDLVISSPKSNTQFPSPLSAKSPSPRPIRELLLSPSPLRRSRTRLANRYEMAVEEVAESVGPRKRSKTKGGQKTLLPCASPRNTRRSRRRSDTVEMKEDREMGVVDEIVKPRKRKSSVRSKKEKLSLVPSLPSPTSTPKIENVNQADLDRIGDMINDLVMWRDVAKSTLWFGFGSLCFLSSCFAKGVNFSIFSAISQLGLLFLGASFFSSSICQRNDDGKRRDFKLREDDILRIARRILPVTNFATSKMRELFSGDPSMTLKVTPFLLLGAEYGHFITLWRLCAFGFFLSFTVPMLYSCYASQINQKGEKMKQRIVEAWRACSHKKIVAASAVTAFWNLTSVKTRIFTAFIFLVVIRYRRQHLKLNSGEAEAEIVAEAEAEAEIETMVEAEAEIVTVAEEAETEKEQEKAL